LFLAFMLAAWAEGGVPVPELAKIGKPAEYDLLGPKLTAEQFQAFAQRADKGDAFAQDAVFYATWRGFGTKPNLAQAREYHIRAYKSGSPLAVAYEGRNLQGLQLNHIRTDQVAARLHFEKALTFFQPLAEAGSPMAMNVVGLCRNGLRDFPTALKFYEKAVAAGNVSAIHNLALCLRAGPTDRIRALFAQAAKLGVHQAKVRLARMHLDTKDCPGDAAEAAGMCKEAADTGDTEAIRTLAEMYLLGVGVKQDPDEGLRLIGASSGSGKVRAASAGLKCEKQKAYGAARAVYTLGVKDKDPLAMYYLAGLHKRGLGGPVDYAKAFTLTKAAADRGLLNAFDDLPWYYQTGRGTPKDPQLAFKWLQKSADMAKMRNASFPICRLGLAHMKGLGTAADTDKGLGLIRQAAADGCSEAHNVLAMLYGHGLYGVRKDQEASAAWYKKNVEAWEKHQRETGLPPSGSGREAFYRYALCLRNGWGVPKDLPRSVAYLRVAAANVFLEAGLADAQVQLGVAYRDGLGVPVDLPEAARWFQEAANQNQADGLRFLSWLYRDGKGVVMNAALAESLLKQAEEQAQKDAMQELDEIVDPPLPPRPDMEF
jgi:hypothetical protein